MAATTISSRPTWTDDTGTAANPNADGTIINNARLQADVYDVIDALFAGAGAYATFTLGGKFAVEGFGSHLFSASGSGANELQVKNTSAGTGNFGRLSANSDTVGSIIDSYSSTYTTSGSSVQAGTLFQGNGSGGVSIQASHASGMIRFYTVATERMRVHASGGVTVGDTTDPGDTNFRVAGTTRCVGAVTLDATLTGVSGSLTRTTDGNVLDVVNSNATFTGEALTVHTSRAANSAFNLFAAYANAVAQFTVTGNGNVSMAGTLSVTGTSTLTGAVTVGATTLKAHASGGVSVGDATDPGATNFRVAGTTALVGAVTLSSTLTAGGNFILGANYLSGDGGNEGITVSAAGAVTCSGTLNAIGAVDCDSTLNVDGAATIDGAMSVLYAGAGTGIEMSTVAGFFGNVLDLNDHATGTGSNSSGARIILGRNTSGTGAAGHIQFTEKGGSTRVVWVDASHDVRIGTASPVEDNSVSDTGGTVVGTQTSTRESKHLLGLYVDDDDALARIVSAPLYRFTYRSGAYNGSEFVGIVAGECPWAVMDHGRSFSPVSAFGYSVAAFKALTRRVARLEALAA